jgi:hypothetical protein
MKKRIFKIAGISLLVVLIGIQFITIDKNNPPVDESLNFFSTESFSPEGMELVQNACYDCHSNESKYPWYSNIAPVSFVLAGHIKEGREELNFSEYQSYGAKKKDHKLEEISEALREGWMPIDNYVWMHSEAKLTAEQRENLAKEFDAVRSNLGFQKAESKQNDAHEEHDNHDD